MRRIGVIDIESSAGAERRDLPFPLSIYVFRSHKKEWELERSYHCDDLATCPSHRMDNIREFYLSLPLNLLSFRILKLPFSDPEKINRVIPLELDSLIMEGSAQVVFACTVLGGFPGEYEILVSYAKKETLADILAKLGELNITIITSIELKNILTRPREEIALQLMSAEAVAPDLRINLAREELKNNTINLRSGTFIVTQEDRRWRKAWQVTAVLSLLLALTIGINLGIRIFTVKGEVNSLKEETRAIYTGLFPQEKKIVNELDQLKSHLKGLEERKDTLSGVTPLQVMMNLSGRLGQGASLQEITMDKDLIVLKGEASSMAEADKMKTGLFQVFKEATMAEVNPSASGRVYFKIFAKGVKENP